MKVERRLEALRDVGRPVFLAIGFFDGVHRGHQRILETAVQNARATGGEAWVLTFDPHPAKVLKPDRAPPLLTSPAHKVGLLQKAGLDGCIVLPFTRELAQSEPEHFLARLQDMVPRRGGGIQLEIRAESSR